MKTGKVNTIYVLSVLIIILAVTVSSTGLFYTIGGKAYDFVNQYGDTVKIYGNGLYSHDSYFKAPILRGTDFTILFFAVPALAISLILDIRKKSIKTKMFLTSVISVFTYYSASLSLGVTYNSLHLVYISLFSVSVFALITAIASMDLKKVADSIDNPLPYKGIYIFLAFTGAALIAAWLPDIISSLVSGRSLALIEIYTTEITYVLDMGIIGPAAFICLFKLVKHNGFGYVLLSILLTLCITIGVMIPLQTVFQSMAGIETPIPVLITKVGSFVVLSFFAVYFNIKLYTKMKFN